MIHTSSILNEKTRSRKLRFFPVEKPLALQLGGSDPEQLARASQIGEQFGYDQINLNCGCPSPKVQCGSFGACLMKDPELVSKCLKKMKESVKIPVTCKCRLGVDEFDSYEFFREFIDKVQKESSIDTFVVHARKAFLKGLNPKQNRDVPPLRYDWVEQIIEEFPHLNFILNGGIKSLEEGLSLMQKIPQLKGVMLGRAVCQNPMSFSEIDSKMYSKEDQNLSREEVLWMYG